MKRLFSAVCLFFTFVSMMAQFYVWKDGVVVFSYNAELADSITFSNPFEKYYFSVSDNKKVRFSPGNLQMNDATFTWRFSENQYDVIGYGNSNIDYMYDGWIDLFGWATCGWSSGFEPSSTSVDYRDYLVGGSWDNSMVGEYALADWGVANKIENWENTKWRTLTSQEWNYIFAVRDNADKLFALATVAGQKGLVVLPDTWCLPEGLTFMPSAEHRLVYANGLYEDDEYLEDNYEDNVYSDSEWKKMEFAGAVFLPAAGRRWGISIKNFGDKPWGVYWSTTTGAQEREGNVRALSFYMSGVTPLAETSRVWGCSVRLVQDVE